MSQVKGLLYKLRWWILSCSSLVMFVLIALLAIAILGTGPGNSPSQESIPLPTLENTSLPGATAFPLFTSQPTIPVPQITEGIFTEIPPREIAFVQQVIDGDSVKIILDGTEYDLRYIGIDAPEVGMPFHKEATEANKQLVEGQIVELERDKSDRDQYGRLLRYVYLSDGTLVNAQLILLGLAIAHAYPPDTRYQSMFSSFEQEAREAELGLWAPVPTPTIQETLAQEENVQIDPSCSQFNAPGNDNQNKNEEYVCLVNLGTAGVDFAGWKIHDEYGWTYQFLDFSLGSGAEVRVRTGCGSDDLGNLYWCKDETAVWNNDGDCAYLINNEGIEVAKYCY